MIITITTTKIYPNGVIEHKIEKKLKKSKKPATKRTMRVQPEYDSDESQHVEVESELEVDDKLDDESEQEIVEASRKKLDSDMRKYFQDGQRIRHETQKDIWIGHYDRKTNKIFCNGNHYYSLSGFAKTHKKAINPNIFGNTNGRTDCEIEVNGRWVSPPPRQPLC